MIIYIFTLTNRAQIPIKNVKMEAKGLKISKLVQDARIEYFNAKLEKLEARLIKVSKLMGSDDVQYGSEQYELLREEQIDLRSDRNRTEEFISREGLHRYDELTITATGDVMAAYSCDASRFGSKCTATQAKLLRREMRLACMMADAGDRFTVRVEYWSSFVAYKIEKIQPDESIPSLLSRIFDTRAGIITKRGAHTIH